MIINIKKSLFLTAVVSGAHVGALLLIVALPMLSELKIGLAVLIGVSLWWQFRYGAWASECEIILDENGTCLCAAIGEPRRYRISRATAHAGFMRLMLERAGERTRILLVPRDAIAPEVYRDFRARIVQRRLPAPDTFPV